MPKKIRELKSMLRQAGWIEISGGGKGSHTTWQHPNVPQTLTVSGNDGNDARLYQEKYVKMAIREAMSDKGGGQ
jgi:predicted RNA binding protein YcfA (HicA-like mRNA interferase family)